MIESIDESEINSSHDHENKEWDQKYHVMNLKSSTILMLNKELKTMIAKSSINLLIYYYICTHIVTLLRTFTFWSIEIITIRVRYESIFLFIIFHNSEFHHYDTNQTKHVSEFSREFEIWFSITNRNCNVKWINDNERDFWYVRHADYRSIKNLELCNLAARIESIRQKMSTNTTSSRSAKDQSS